MKDLKMPNQDVMSICHLPSRIWHAQKSCRNAKLTGLMSSGWPGSDSCSFPSLVLISSCPFGDVFSLLNHFANESAFAICFNGHLPSQIWQNWLARWTRNGWAVILVPLHPSLGLISECHFGDGTSLFKHIANGQKSPASHCPSVN